MKKNRRVLLIGTIMLAMSLGGCSNESKLDSTKILENFEKIVYDQKGSRHDVREYISKNISSINSREMSSSMVNTFIYFVYENIDVYTNVVFGLQEDLIEIEKSLGVESVSIDNVYDIPNDYKLVKALLQELNENFLVLIKSNDSYVVDVDMEKIKEEYYDYMDDDTLTYLDFRMKENDSNVYDVNSDEYNIELLLKKANMICTNLENLEGNSQNQNWIQHLYYYLEMIVSKSQTTFLDKDGKMLIDKFNSLKEESDKYSDTNFGKMLEKYLNLLEENDYYVDSEKVNAFVDEVYDKLDAFLVDNK